MPSNPGEARSAKRLSSRLHASRVRCRGGLCGRLRLPEEPGQFLGLRETGPGEEFAGGVPVRIHRRSKGPWEECKRACRSVKPKRVMVSTRTAMKPFDRLAGDGIFQIRCRSSDRPLSVLNARNRQFLPTSWGRIFAEAAAGGCAADVGALKVEFTLTYRGGVPSGDRLASARPAGHDSQRDRRHR